MYHLIGRWLQRNSRRFERDERRVILEAQEKVRKPAWDLQRDYREEEAAALYESLPTRVDEAKRRVREAQQLQGRRIAEASFICNPDQVKEVGKILNEKKADYGAHSAWRAAPPTKHKNLSEIAREYGETREAVEEYKASTGCSHMPKGTKGNDGGSEWTVV